jgi:hypothetical protein
MEERIMEYLHPIVSSQIIDNSISFVSAQGVTSLFCAFTSDIGPDNKIVQLTSPSEAIFYFGEPNMRKHGQALYNVMNWLNSNGGVYALRVLPENAGYAHVIVNIQTKTATKMVKSASGALVEVPDVKVRTVAAYTPVNNISEEALETELNKVDREKTIDGYENHWLVAFYPKGRGEGYNNLGIRLTLSDAYDDTYAFRLYNFEVTKTSETGSIQVIEGPFLVSMDPDAVSRSNESMFIKYVVEKYSQYYNVLFNEAAYDQLGEIINPYVNPAVLDFFHGVTRVVGGAPETYYDDITGKDEDVHMSIHAYNSNGDRIAGVTNYVDTTDTVEASIVDMDDTVRGNAYNKKLIALDTTKEVLSKVKTGASAFKTFVGKIATISTVVDTSTLTGGSLYTANTAFETAHGGFETALTNYGQTQNDTTLLALENSISDVVSKIKTVIAESQDILGIVRTVNNTPAILSTMVKVESLEGTMNAYDVILVQKASREAKLGTLRNTLNTAFTKADKLAAITTTLTVASEALEFADTIESATDERIESDQAIADARASYASLVRAYNEATDVNLLATEVDGQVNNSHEIAKVFVDNTLKALRLAIVENGIATLDTASIDILTIISEITDQVADATAEIEGLTTDAEKEAKYAEIANNIEAIKGDVLVAKQLTYNLKLQAFDSYVSLMQGTDGDLTDGAQGREDAIKSLLVKAYKGLIDPTLTNKKEILIDMVLDANYDTEVKNAIVQLSTEIRADFMSILDTKFTANHQQALTYRSNSIPVSSYMVAIFTQDFVVYDEYTGRDIKVTSPYFLASKIPANDEQYGIQYPFVGPRRGTISGFKKLSWNPTETAKEDLYKKQVNYIEQDPRRTKFGTQLTSQTVVSALSDINNVRALLRIKRDVEILAEDYQFEFADDITLNAFQYNLDATLQKWVSNRACTSISGTVYQSEYDKVQKTARVKVDIVFNSVIERILIDFVVGR